MDSLETTASFTDNLLDFSSSDLSTEDNDDTLSFRHSRPAFSLIPCPPPSFPEYVEEEELEWISNKDAFPMVESFVDIIPNHPSISSTTTLGNNSNNSNSSLLSPVSVLENSSSGSNGNGNGNGRSLSGAGAIAAMISLTGIFKVPGKARSKQLRRRRKEMNGEGFRFWEKVKPCSSKSRGVVGRKCLHCGSDKTPQWRAGPLGPKTLCNACGVRYKSGRLVPEYRPASSPTFSSELHSNSHRKIVEMRKQKTVMGVGEPEEKEKPAGVS